MLIHKRCYRVFSVTMCSPQLQRLTETKEIKYASHREVNLTKSKTISLPILHKGAPLVDPRKANQNKLSHCSAKNHFMGELHQLQASSLVTSTVLQGCSAITGATC